MGNKKYIMCSGLAFADEEDMKMLHEYAKEGWIFERIRFGMSVSYTHLGISRGGKHDAGGYVSFYK